MALRIVLVFNTDDPDCSSRKEIDEYAERLNEDAAHYLGYEGWRVENDE